MTWGFCIIWNYVIWEVNVVPKWREVFGDIEGGCGAGKVMKNDVLLDL
jgi:hypothetical protein